MYAFVLTGRRKIAHKCHVVIIIAVILQTAYLTASYNLFRSLLTCFGFYNPIARSSSPSHRTILYAVHLLKLNEM
jgi:hypothetical protein